MSGGQQQGVPTAIVKERIVICFIILFTLWSWGTYLKFCFYDSIWLTLTLPMSSKHLLRKLSRESLHHNEAAAAKTAYYMFKTSGWNFELVAKSQWVWLGITLFLMGMAMWAFIQCLVTDPGKVPPAFSLNAVLDESSPLGNVLAKKDTCQPCGIFKPTRTHHCSRCGRCTLKYDHHCPWVGRCIGFHNYKLFLLMVTYIFLLGFFVCLTLSRSVYLHLLGSIHENTSVHSEMHRWSRDTRRLVKAVPESFLRNAETSSPDLFGWDIMLVFFASFLAQSFCSTLMWRHYWLIKRNATTVEQVMYGSHFVSEYDLGPRENWLQVFGGSVVSTSILDRLTECSSPPTQPATYGATDNLPPTTKSGSSSDCGAHDKEGRFIMSPPPGTRPAGYKSFVDELIPKPLGWRWWIRAFLPLRAYPEMDPVTAAPSYAGTTFKSTFMGHSTSVVVQEDLDSPRQMHQVVRGESAPLTNTNDPFDLHVDLSDDD